MSYFDVFVYVLLSIGTVCTLLSSVRMAVARIDSVPSNRVVRIATSYWWSIGAVLIALVHMGDYARGEAFALPWHQFYREAARHGTLDGIVSATTVVIADLWLFWVPARIYVANQPDDDRRVRYLAIALNMALGLILTSPDNLIYRIIASGGGSDPGLPNY